MQGEEQRLIRRMVVVVALVEPTLKNWYQSCQEIHIRLLLAAQLQDQLEQVHREIPPGLVLPELSMQREAREEPHRMEVLPPGALDQLPAV